MHAIQTSGNCIRNVTADHFAGAAADEIEDPRPYAEIIRQWSTLHPEFIFLPRKFKIAVTGAPNDRAAIQVHDIGLHAKRDADGRPGFAVYVGGGLGRTPMIGHKIRDFLPEADLLSYLEAILRVYNLFGRRDNKYKARIKILVHETGVDEIRRQVEAEWQRIRAGALRLPEEECAASRPISPRRRSDAAAGDKRRPRARRGRQSGVRRLGRAEHGAAPRQRLCHRHRLAEADRRHAGRRHGRADGAGRRPRRALQPRRDARQPRAEPGPAACGAGRPAGAP